eukprot:5409681-Pleurochrysis_carterae.AAC.3
MSPARDHTTLSGTTVGACAHMLYTARHSALASVSSIFTASHSIALCADDVMACHRPAHVRSATPFTRARALVSRHGDALRFICTFCLVWCMYTTPLHTVHTSVSPMLSTSLRTFTHAYPTATHLLAAAASIAHALPPRIAPPASPLISPRRAVAASIQSDILTLPSLPTSLLRCAAHSARRATAFCVLHQPAPRRRSCACLHMRANFLPHHEPLAIAGCPLFCSICRE